jgi:outer membrane protein assembly factor BamB/predicted Ser/Thr protein kinase
MTSAKSHHPPLERVLAEYIEAAERGGDIRLDAWLARYPQFAGELREFAADRERMSKWAAAASPGVNQPTVIGAVAKTSEVSEDFGSRKADPMPPRVRYFGDYELLEEIARGGMGVVYRARQVNLKRIVALKMILVGQLAHDDDVRRFRAEAQAAAKLEHPHIVPIFEIGEHEGQHYFSMAYIDGESLAHRVSRGVLPPREAAEILHKAARAIAFAHVEGVVHRDLKPANILIDQAGEPHITDFGLAKRVGGDRPGETVASNLTATGQVLGTPSYMPPEQAAGNTADVGPLADVYSLGAVLYCLLTGRPPFQAASPIDTLLQVIQQEPVSPRVLNPAIPRDLETICQKCLEKDPARRYASAAELADDLQRYLHDEPIVARPISQAERLVRLAKKHRQMLLRTVATVAASLLVAVGVWSGWVAYRTAQLGAIELRTHGPHLVAEVIDDEDRPVVPSFPVPTQTPVTLPAGSYRVRLSASGLLSDTWPLEVERGRSQPFDVESRSRLMWPPREIATEDSIETEIVDLKDHASILQIRHGYEDGAYFHTLQLIDGATGQPAWPNGRTLDKNNVPMGRPADEWVRLLGVSGVLARDERLTRPLVDLDGDGVRDLVFVARTSPSLVAFSGRDGSLLWWRRSLPFLPDGADQQSAEQTTVGQGSVVGRATLADINGDGVADALAVFMSARVPFRLPDGKVVSAEQQGWIEAVSGKDGTPLWRQPLEANFDSFLHSSDPGRRFNEATQPLIVRSPAGDEVVLAVDGSLCRFERTTGRVIEQWKDWDVTPLQAPQVADLDGNGVDELLLLSKAADDPSGRNRDRVTLTAVSLHKETLWSTTYQPLKTEYELRNTARPLFFVQDLGNDGRLEVLIPTGEFGYSPDSRWSGVAALDGVTGATLWQRRLFEARSDSPAVDRLAIGGDLDGDGWREVFAAWHGHVAALSGRDGNRLWQFDHATASSRSVPDTSGPLAWGQPGHDGWPLLVVPVAAGPGGQAMTFFLQASTGRVAHTLSEVSAPHIADFNSDGIVDVYYTVSPQGAPRMMIARGTQSEPWTRLGQWDAIRDVDGDRVDDMLEAQGNAIFSGRTNQPLWSLHSEFYDSHRHPVLSPPLPHGDLDRDGVPDLIGVQQVLRRITSYSASSENTLAAVSGMTGRRIWIAEGFSLSHGGGGTSASNWSIDYPLYDWCDLDDDGRAEILVVANDHHSSSNRLMLSLLSGSDGRVMWQIPIVLGTIGSRPDPYQRQFEDLNGDGVRDIVAWTPLAGPGQESNFNAPCELQAFSGHDGRPLWPIVPVALRQGGSRLWPRPAVGDLDGDGQCEVIAARNTGYDPEKGQACELTVIDGRTGQVKWTHAWDGNAQILPPLLVDFDGDGKRSVCFGNWGADGFQLVMLDAEGRPLPGSPQPISSRGQSAITALWNTCDLHGDGKQAVLFVNDNQLCALRGPNDIAWQWPLGESKQREYTSSGGVPIDVQSGGKGRPATLVIWAGQAVYGLNAADAAQRWRCDVPWSPGAGFSSPPEVQLLASDDPSGAPRVLCRWRSYSDDRWRTTVRQAWATTPEGRFVLPAPAPRTYAPLAEAPVPGRKLPWVSGPSSSWKAWLTSILVPTGLLAALVAVVPAWLAYLTLRRRSWLAGLALAAYAACLLNAPFYQQGVSSLIALSVSVGLVWRAVRERTWTPALWGIGYALLVVAPLALFHARLADHSLATMHLLGKWWWLDELFGETLLVVLMTSPGLMFWWRFVPAVWQQQWRLVRGLLVAATVLAAACAVVMLAIDAPRLSHGRSYSLDHWYMVWFWGVYLVGAGLLLKAIARRAAEWMRSPVSRKAPGF